VTTETPGRASTQVDPAQASVGDLFGELTRDMSTLVRQEVQLAKTELLQETTKAGKELTRDMSTLVRQEVQLAKAELLQETTKASKAAGTFGVASLAGYMVLLFLSFALWWGLANVIDEGWAALVVASVWAVIAAVLFPVRRKRMRQIRGLPQTAETARQVPAAPKGQ
jgi:Putative Actinobacterial Holin-X, holin superfamily III